MKIAINLLRTVLTLTLAALLFLCIWLQLSRYIWKQEPASLLGCTLLPVTSSSMEPAFSEGDAVFIQAKEDYVLGDALAFYNPEGSEIITHRIVGLHSGGFITRGDANATEDQTLVAKEKIIGEIKISFSGAGILLEFLALPAAVPIILLFGILLLFLPRLLRYRGEKKAQGRHRR